MTRCKVFTLVVLAICLFQTSKALKCYTCEYKGQSTPETQSRDASCVATGVNSVECSKPEQVCATFSVPSPNITRRQCLDKTSIDHETINSCYTDTIDKLKDIATFSGLTGNVEVCLCDTDDCVVPKSKETKSETPVPPTEKIGTEAQAEEITSKPASQPIATATSDSVSVNMHTLTWFTSLLFTFNFLFSNLK